MPQAVGRPGPPMEGPFVRIASMELTRDNVAKIARLSRLRLTDDELDLRRVTFGDPNDLFREEAVRADIAQRDGDLVSSRM